MNGLPKWRVTLRACALAFAVAIPVACAMSACGGATRTAPASDAGSPTSDGASGQDDASTTTPDAATLTEAEILDGPVTRNKCTNDFGTGLTAAYGRMDGILVSIVPLTSHNCNGDSSHVHLQVLVNGGIYDVAVNTDGLEFQLDHAMIGKPWTEGWDTTVSLDYPTDLNVHNTSFATTDTDSILTALDNVNHITIYATGYGTDGAHLVHRNGTNQDGALVLDPLSPIPHFLVFCFTGDTF